MWTTETLYFSSCIAFVQVVLEESFVQGLTKRAYFLFMKSEQHAQLKVYNWEVTECVRVSWKTGLHRFDFKN